MFSGTKRTRAGEVEHGLVAAALALDTHEVLRVGETGDVVTVAAVHRKPAHPVGDRQIEGSRDGGVVVDDEHVGARHHHLAHDGVAELDDALDELALFVLDDIVVRGGTDDAEQLLLADEGSLLETLSWDEHVGEDDERPTHQTQRRERHQPLGRPGGEQGGALGGHHRPRLGHRLGEHEEDDDVEHEPDGDALRPEQVVGEQRGEERLAHLQHGDRDEQRVDEALGVGDEAQQRLRRLRPPRVGDRLRLDA